MKPLADRLHRLPLPSSVVGLAATALVLAFAVGLTGDAADFVDPAALLLVAGGTLTVTLSACSWSDLGHTVRLLPRVLLGGGDDGPARLGVELVRLARLARREGLLALERLVAPMSALPVLQRGIELVLEGRETASIGRLLEHELNRRLLAWHKAEAVLRQAAEVAPAMGLLGTLVGLVRMLATLDAPDRIGPGMAVALLTTLYGALLGYAVLTPLADRLARARDEEERLLRIQAETVLSIGRRENPQLLAGTIASLMPPDLDALALLEETES